MALGLIGRLAARLIHPQPAWFAVFACLARLGPFADVDAVLFETGSGSGVVERRSGIR